MLLVYSRGSLGVTTCASIRSEPTAFCRNVRWNASLPLSLGELDGAARLDYQIAVETLSKPGKPPPSELCLESWKALQCASKFPKCSSGMPPHKVGPCHSAAGRIWILTSVPSPHRSAALSATSSRTRAIPRTLYSQDAPIGFSTTTRPARTM